MSHYTFKPIIAALLIGSQSLNAETVSGVFTYTERGLGASIIYIDSDKDVAPVTVRVNQVNKEFSEKIIIAPKGSKITFDNSDTVQHNVFVNNQEAGVEYGSKLSDPGTSADMPIDCNDYTFISVGCKIHPKMRLWVGNLKSEHVYVAEFAKGKLRKEASLEGVADSAQSIKIWIPRFDPAELELAPGEAKSVEVTRKGKA